MMPLVSVSLPCVDDRAAFATDDLCGGTIQLPITVANRRPAGECSTGSYLFGHSSPHLMKGESLVGAV